MLTRALDEIIHATRSLPDHLIAARRSFSDSPEALVALRQLQDALMEVDAKVVRGKAGPHLTSPASGRGAAGDDLLLSSPLPRAGEVG